MEPLYLQSLQVHQNNSSSLLQVTSASGNQGLGQVTVVSVIFNAKKKMPFYIFPSVVVYALECLRSLDMQFSSAVQLT